MTSTSIGVVVIKILEKFSTAYQQTHRSIKLSQIYFIRHVNLLTTIDLLSTNEFDDHPKTQLRSYWIKILISLSYIIIVRVTYNCLNFKCIKEIQKR